MLPAVRWLNNFVVNSKLPETTVEFNSLSEFVVCVSQQCKYSDRMVNLILN